VLRENSGLHRSLHCADGINDEAEFRIGLAVVGSVRGD
jgi:hypothetical protein